MGIPVFIQFNTRPRRPTLSSVADQAPPAIVVLVAKGGAAAQAFNASLSGERARARFSRVGIDRRRRAGSGGLGGPWTEQRDPAQCGVACSTRGA